MHYVIETIGPIDRDHLTEVVLTYMRFVSYYPLGKNRPARLSSGTRPVFSHPVPVGRQAAALGTQSTGLSLSPFGAGGFGAAPGRGPLLGTFGFASARAGTRINHGPPMVLQTGTPIAIQPNVRIQQVSDLGQTYQHLFFWDGMGRTQVLSVTAEGAHYEWARLRQDWNNPRFAFAPPADLRGYSAGRLPMGSAASMSLAEKLLKALWYALQIVPGDIKDIVRSMMESENIGKLVLIETVYAASMFFGVGEVATLALVVWGVYCVGEQVITFIKDLQALVEALDKAQSEADLQGAGAKLAAVLIAGIEIARALFLRGKGSSANRPTVVVRAKAGNSGGKKPAGSGSHGAAATPPSAPPSKAGGSSSSGGSSPTGPKPSKTGKGKNRLEPHPDAQGDHSTYERDNNGDVYKYETYEKTSSGHDDPKVRFDGGKPDGTPGNPHRDRTGNQIPTPHTQGKSIPEGARPPKPNEYPNNKRFPKTPPEKP